ncbi:predicted protein [Thalassiosira pseudonana CCMP1335]|uniref:Uncharacterized protein n=1 Tax=Thalassiosira pseudonana TaxID=35128 RepID=B8C0A1_THAPS|nr:predicted protein [Thalassiosira pseudonana CCMP1335]EED93027.1 predicted protein [Thalassiosira pseudonana CCMP1335]
MKYLFIQAALMLALGHVHGQRHQYHDQRYLEDASSEDAPNEEAEADEAVKEEDQVYDGVYEADASTDVEEESFDTTFASTVYVAKEQVYNDVSPYTLRFNGRCTSIKAGVNYNYHSDANHYANNYEQYLTFHTCPTSKRLSWGSGCNKAVEHNATSINATNTVDFCEAKCISSCNSYASMTGSNANDAYAYDGGSYLDTYYGCSQVTDQTQGYTYYYGAMCSEKGGLTMGYYFDEYCQVNATTRSISSVASFIDFDVFGFVNEICIAPLTAVLILNRMIVGTYDNSGDQGKDGNNEERHEREDNREEEDRNSRDSQEFEMSGEDVCFAVYTAEHFQSIRNKEIAVHYLKTTGGFMKHVSIIACYTMLICGAVFIFVSYNYYARHRGWANGESVADFTSVEESVADFTSVDEESYAVSTAYSRASEEGDRAVT